MVSDSCASLEMSVRANKSILPGTLVTAEGFILTWLAAAAPFGITNRSRTPPTSLTRKPPVSDFVADLSKENGLCDAEISRGQAVDLFT